MAGYAYTSLAVTVSQQVESRIRTKGLSTAARVRYLLPGLKNQQAICLVPESSSVGRAPAAKCPEYQANR
ncbi:hypothetical protein ACLOJK_011650 [Asimina triloba]